MDFADIIDLFTAAKPGKACFKCFVLRTCKFGFRSLFLYQKSFAVSSIWKKYSFSNFCDFCIFKNHIIMNTKLRFQVGPGSLISPVRHGPCVLIRHCLEDSLQVSNFLHRPFSSLQWKSPQKFPLSYCEFSLIYIYCCVVKRDLVTLVIIVILEDTAAFQVLFLVSLFCAWNITTMEINSGVHLLKS